MIGATGKGEEAGQSGDRADGRDLASHQLDVIGSPSHPRSGGSESKNSEEKISRENREWVTIKKGTHHLVGSLDEPIIA